MTIHFSDLGIKMKRTEKKGVDRIEPWPHVLVTVENWKELNKNCFFTRKQNDFPKRGGGGLKNIYFKYRPLLKSA